MNLDLYIQYGPLLLDGLLTTAYICGLAAVIGIALGLAVAIASSVPFAPVRWLCRLYIEVMRGTPILILLFLIYYGGPSVGIRLSAEVVGIFGLGIYIGGYFAEIFRSGFESIPPGQIEAARISGLTSAQIIARIKLPQMLGLIVPPGINQLIILVKESALLSIISVAELTKNATQIVNETYVVVEPYLAIAILYWILIEGLSQFGRAIERRIRI
ncbi:MAG: amino acid ABC transporter permease [Halofilum sp. (in: g-proteobacteria)]